jgi:hypothetical protein
MAHRGSSGIALPFLDHGTRRGWVGHTWLFFIPRKDPVPIVQEAGWAPGPVCTGVENLATTGSRSPDCPARSQLLYQLRYLAHKFICTCDSFWLVTGTEQFESDLRTGVAKNVEIGGGFSSIYYCNKFVISIYQICHLNLRLKWNNNKLLLILHYNLHYFYICRFKEFSLGNHSELDTCSFELFSWQWLIL